MTNLECIEYASKYSFKGLYEKGINDAMNGDGIPTQLVEMGYKKGLRDMLTQIVCEYYNGVGGSFEHYLDELQEQYKEVEDDRREI